MSRAPFPAAVLVCLGAVAVAVVECAARRLVCWEAIMQCQSEPECHYAYGQYMHACEPVLTGRKTTCPSHCIASLVQLNLTRGGPALEDCNCASDPRCFKAKRAIEPCLPRTSSLGCTEARRQCEDDHQCSAAMSSYIAHCGKLFGGAACSSACKEVIADMRRLPKAQLLDTCICDGRDRTICEYVKLKMKNLCFGEPPEDDVDDEDEGSGPIDYYEEDDEDYAKVRSTTGSGRSTLGTSACLALPVGVIFSLVQFLS
ncbi:growth arrest-specific protein 1-like [Hoplias malabaricus]|uniref:growth arrest-specific protein 1-like n=1 Tax=Hoplias malabaricus TaxID=27720 RepID=UPI003461E925